MLSLRVDPGPKTLGPDPDANPLTLTLIPTLRPDPLLSLVLTEALTLPYLPSA